MAKPLTVLYNLGICQTNLIQISPESKWGVPGSSNPWWSLVCTWLWAELRFIHPLVELGLYLVVSWAAVLPLLGGAWSEPGCELNCSASTPWGRLVCTWLWAELRCFHSMVALGLYLVVSWTEVLPLLEGAWFEPGCDLKCGASTLLVALGLYLVVSWTAVLPLLGGAWSGSVIFL